MIKDLVSRCHEFGYFSLNKNKNNLHLQYHFNVSEFFIQFYYNCQFTKILISLTNIEVEGNHRFLSLFFFFSKIPKRKMDQIFSHAQDTKNDKQKSYLTIQFRKNEINNTLINKQKKNYQKKKLYIRQCCPIENMNQEISETMLSAMSIKKRLSATACGFGKPRLV